MMPLWAKLAICCLGGVMALLVLARLLARQAIQTAIERERFDRTMDRAKRDEEERAAKEKSQIAADLAADDAKIDAMKPADVEREINE